MSAMASQITNLTIVYPTLYSGVDKMSKLRITGLCAGNSPGIGEFPGQRTSNVENVSIWWRHHGISTPEQVVLEDTGKIYKYQVTAKLLKLVSVDCIIHMAHQYYKSTIYFIKIIWFSQIDAQLSCSCYPYIKIAFLMIRVPNGLVHRMTYGRIHTHRYTYVFINIHHNIYMCTCNLLYNNMYITHNV